MSAVQQRVFGWFWGISALWLADGLSAALSQKVRPEAGGMLARALGAVLYFGWVSVLAAVVLGTLHALAAETTRRALDGLGLGSSVWGRALASASLSALSVLAYRTALHAATHFHNHELASLLLVGVLAAGGALLFALLAPATRGLSALVARVRWFAIPLGFSLYLVAWAGALHLLWDNRAGIAQLHSGLRTGGLALLCSVPVALFVGRRLTWVRGFWLNGALGGVALASLLVSAFGSAFPRRVEAEAGWAGRALSGLRKISDVDGDGASAWFGGGDCAPFDPKIHPLALEVIGDGIDNNCLGGDRKKPVSSPPPRWTGPLSDAPDAQNVLLLTIDTVRPDHLPMFGYDRNTTPNLAKLAKQSVLMERVYTGAPLTRLAVSSLFASQRASRLHWRGIERARPMPKIDQGQPWLPRILQLEGFLTSAVVPSFAAFRRSGGHGFNLGFRHYDDSASMRYKGGTMRGFPAEEQIDKAIDWLDEHGQERFFLWVHLVEPHFQYERRDDAPKWGNSPIDLYDAELWWADKQSGRLLDHLRASERWEDTIVVVAGDHGESFQEHGNRFHGFDLYETGIRTLGMIRAPGLAPRRIDAPVSLVDLAPTLLNLLGIERQHDELRGRNLVPVLRGQHAPDSRIVVELFRLPMKGYHLAVIDGPHKLTFTSASGQFHYVDLERDPDELAPLPRVPEGQGALLDYLTAVLESTRVEQEKEAAKLAREKAEREARLAKARAKREAERQARKSAVFVRPAPSLLRYGSEPEIGPFADSYRPPPPGYSP